MTNPRVIAGTPYPHKVVRLIEGNTRRLLAFTTLLGAEAAGVAIVVASLMSGDTQMAFQVFLILGGYAAGALNGYSLARVREEKHGNEDESTRPATPA